MNNNSYDPDLQCHDNAFWNVVLIKIFRESRRILAAWIAWIVLPIWSRFVNGNMNSSSYLLTSGRYPHLPDPYIELISILHLVWRRWWFVFLSPHVCICHDCLFQSSLKSDQQVNRRNKRIMSYADVVKGASLSDQNCPTSGDSEAMSFLAPGTLAYSGSSNPDIFSPSRPISPYGETFTSPSTSSEEEDSEEEKLLTDDSDESDSTDSASSVASIATPHRAVVHSSSSSDQCGSFLSLDLADKHLPTTQSTLAMSTSRLRTLKVSTEHIEDLSSELCLPTLVPLWLCISRVPFDLTREAVALKLELYRKRLSGCVSWITTISIPTF